MIVGSFQCKWVTFEVDLSLSKVCGFYFAKLLTTTNTCGVKFAVLCSQPFRLWTSVDLCGGGNPIHICSGIVLVLSDTSLHRYWAKLWKYGIWNWCLYNQRRLSKRNNAHSMFEKPFCNVLLYFFDRKFCILLLYSTGMLWHQYLFTHITNFWWYCCVESKLLLFVTSMSTGSPFGGLLQQWVCS